MRWISCYDRMPAGKLVMGHFRGLIHTKYSGRSCSVIGWIWRAERKHSEVHEWMPIPE